MYPSIRNSVYLIGTVTKLAEVKTVGQRNLQLVTFEMSIPQNEDQRTHVFQYERVQIEAWGKNNLKIAESLTMGQEVGVTATLRTRVVPRKDGIGDNIFMSVVANSIEVLGGDGGQDGQGNTEDDPW